MSAETAIQFGVGGVTLGLAPIVPAWIIEGNPVARNGLVSSTLDGNSSTWMWDCTAGKFNWYYDIDEMVYFIEGSVIIRDTGGTHEPLHLKAGDTVFFPAGSSAEWTVPQYIRKYAILRSPMSSKLLLMRRIYRSLKRLVGKGNGGDNNQPLTFQSR
jgi:uncharacterized cupin superfamily protein